jgi:hypothetical protein
MSDPDTAEDACSVAEIGASEAHVDHDDAPVDESAHSLAPEPVDAMAGSSAVQHEHSTPSVCRFTPSSSGRYLMHASVSRETHDKFRRLQALLSHAVPSGDVDEVMGRAFDAAIRELEKRRFSKDDQPADDSNVRPRRDRPSKNARHIPAEVRRAVHERDGGRCTFTSAKGCRCAETRFLQFDHIIPLARGGKSTVENLRLRCRAHNQYEAERMFGAGFMAEKRASARGTRSARSVTSAGTAGSATGAGSAARSHMRPTRTPANPPLPPEQEELVPWLRALGFTVQEARSGAAACATNPEGSLEERMKLALRSLAPRSARRVLPITTASA